MKYFLAKYSSLVILLMVLFSLPLLAQSDESTEDFPSALTLTNILNGLRSNKATLAKRTQLLIKGADERGVDFEVTPEIETQLKDAGATQALITAVLRGSSLFFYQKVTSGIEDSLEKRLALINKAIQLNPNSRRFSPAYYTERGSIYGEKREDEKALADYSKAIQFIGKNSIRENDTIAMNFTGEPYQYRAEFFERKGEYEKAVADYTTLIGILTSTGPEEELAEGYAARGYVYVLKKEYDRAIADFNQSLTLLADDSYVYNRRGMAYQGKGFYDKAIADYTRAIELNANNFALYITNRVRAENYYNRGSAYELKGDRGKAIADYRKALELDPDYEAAKNALRRVQ